MVSVGITGVSSVLGDNAPETCRDAVRFAAFALAICSRNAADDFRAVDIGASSTESTVNAVEAVEALDKLRPSPEVLDDLADASDALRDGLGGISETIGLSRDGKEGFLYRLFMEALGLKGRTATVFDPCLEAEVSKRFSGLGVEGPTEADNEGREGAFLRLDRGLKVDVALVTGVLEATVETLLVGVPRTVERGGL